MNPSTSRWDDERATHHRAEVRPRRVVEPETALPPPPPEPVREEQEEHVREAACMGWGIADALWGSDD
jgi:hypothetical protein